MPCLPAARKLLSVLRERPCAGSLSLLCASGDVGDPGETIISRFFPLLIPPQPPSPTKSSIRTDRCPSPKFLLLCAIARSSLLSHHCGINSCPPVSCTSDRSRLGSSSLPPCPLDWSDCLSTSATSSRAFLPGLSLRCVTSRRLFLGHVNPASLPIHSHSSRVCASSITCLPETRPSRC